MLEFNFLGKTYISVDDNDMSCLNGECPFINKDCETLQEYDEIPQCMSFYRKDGRNISFKLKEEVYK